jgi:hypothetical protein
MKNGRYFSPVVFSQSLVWIGFFWLGLMMISIGQENQTSLQSAGEQAIKTEENFKIRIGVEEVRIDAVVVDAKGHQITDLAADDFEIHQDGQPNRSLQIARRSQALRSYLLGESFEYITVVYNAGTGDQQPPDLEYQFALYRNGSEIFISKPEAVGVRGEKNHARIPITICSPLIATTKSLCPKPISKAS